MRILLIYPPWIKIYDKYQSAAKLECVSPPLGLCYLASPLIKEQHTVRIIDAESENWQIEKVVKEGLDWNPDLIGLTSTTPIFHTVKKIARLFKKKTKVPIVIGGVHITIMRNQVLKGCKDFDFGVFGEGEKTIVELVRALDQKKGLENILGLIYRRGKEVVQNAPRPLKENLDLIPFPDRRLLNLEHYKHSLPGKGFIRYANIFTSRGCPYRCIFCSQHTMFGRKVRYRSVENVIAELELMINELKIRHIIFMDETLSLNPDRLRGICESIIKKNLKFTWEGWTRANTIDESLLRLMKKAGMIRISFGIESGDPKILKVIKKGITLSEIRKAYKIAKKVGLETRGSLIIGHPYETKKKVLRSLRFVKSLKECDQLYLNICVPYPGTELYEIAQKGEGGMRLLTKDFSKYKRYGEPVIEVNDLKKRDLVKLQRKGLWMFYLTLGRIRYNLKRAGWKAAVKNTVAFLRSIK